MRHPAPHRSVHAQLATVATIAVAVAGLTGCGGDEAPEEARQFCSELKTIEELDTDASGVDLFADAMIRVDEAAPEEIADATAVLRRFIERSTEISELPADEQAGAIEEFGLVQSEFDAAVVGVEEYARDNCPDLEESFFGS